jgi:thiamine-phosphate diphosphorylase/hydroxyethylthiazole kinase
MCTVLAPYKLHSCIHSGCVLVLTGPTDYISDGHSVVSLSNGHEILGRITGAGCIAGTCIATFCAVAAGLTPQNDKEDHARLVKGNMFLGAITGSVD